jgi:hypothetical protein
MSTIEYRRSAINLLGELESLVALVEHISFGANLPSHKQRPFDNGARPVYKVKTYDEKTVTVEDERILGLPVFTYEITLGKKFDPKKHFKQFQQFSDGKWYDYALLLLTDKVIGLFDFASKEIVSTVTVAAPVNELHVESIAASKQTVEHLIELGKQILEVNANNDYAEITDELQKVVELLGYAHLSLLHRTGQRGFFSFAPTETASLLLSELHLGSLDLSKASENLFNETLTDDPILLDSIIPLHQAVRMDVTTEDEFTILSKVRQEF